MSTYGTTNTVVVTPYIASEEFRTALRTALPACLDIPENASLSAASGAGLIAAAKQRGLLTAAEAATSTATLHRVQRLEIARAATGVLTDLGFSLRSRDAETSVILAERGHHVMAVEVLDGGGFQYDIGGIEGSECLQIAANFEDGLRRRGVEYEQVVHTHNDPRGGQLLRRIVKRVEQQPESRRHVKSHGRQIQGGQ